MISSEEAIKIILNQTQNYGSEKISINSATGRILCEDIYADRDFPAFDRVTMDGIAIRYEDFEAGIREFPITCLVSAGTPQVTLTQTGTCIEIMTGAMMVKDADTIISYEKLEINKRVAKVVTDSLKKGQNIHTKGQDKKKGDLLVKKGAKIYAPEVGICTSVGKKEILVSKVPKVVIISSGDELVDANQAPKTHQIRRSNIHTLEAELLMIGIQPKLDHIPDNYNQILWKLSEHLKQYDVLILSGGVSKGKFDFIPKALNELAVQKHFHGISQRPGKPFWFGTKEEKMIFAFPGNPISSFLCYHVYFKPWLESSLNTLPSTKPMAVLGKEVVFKQDLTYFLEVKITYSKKGELIALPMKGNGSGDLANLTDANAFIQLPRGKNIYQAGEVYEVFFYKKNNTN